MTCNSQHLSSTVVSCLCYSPIGLKLSWVLHQREGQGIMGLIVAAGVRGPGDMSRA